MDSLTCWACPVNYGGRYGEAFAGWFSRAYPALDEQARPLAVRELQIAIREAASLGEALKG